MNQPSNTPWWLPSDEVKQVRVVQTKSNSNFIIFAVVIALVAGALGAMVGRSSSTNIGANLVDTKNTVERAPDSISALAARVIPAVVSISINSSSGSGFFLDSDGFILTNNHVVKSNNLGKITVELSNGKKYPAKLIGRDASYDLAVLKIDVTSAPTLQLGNSDNILVGDSVIAIGSPLGLSGTVTSGIISAKNRAVTTGDSSGESSFINALQTDAAINPGNSGGPLVNSAGAVIGVNSAIATLGSSSLSSQSGSIGLGFAIPINQARKTAEQLIKNGKATYPVVGVSVDMQYAGDGARIADTSNAILPGGPAAKAGLRAGDLITKFDGRTITTPEELIVAIRSKNVGDKVEIEYIRSGKTLTTSLTLTAGK